MKDQFTAQLQTPKLHPLPAFGRVEGERSQHFHSPVAPPDRRRLVAAGTRMQRIRGRSH